MNFCFNKNIDIVSVIKTLRYIAALIFFPTSNKQTEVVNNGTIEYGLPGNGHGHFFLLLAVRCAEMSSRAQSLTSSLRILVYPSFFMVLFFVWSYVEFLSSF